MQARQECSQGAGHARQVGAGHALHQPGGQQVAVMVGAGHALQGGVGMARLQGAAGHALQNVSVFACNLVNIFMFCVQVGLVAGHALQVDGAGHAQHGGPQQAGVGHANPGNLVSEKLCC